MFVPWAGPGLAQSRFTACERRHHRLYVSHLFLARAVDCCPPSLKEAEEVRGCLAQLYCNCCCCWVHSRFRFRFCCCCCCWPRFSLPGCNHRFSRCCSDFHCCIHFHICFHIHVRFRFCSCGHCCCCSCVPKAASSGRWCCSCLCG